MHTQLKNTVIAFVVAASLPAILAPAASAVDPNEAECADAGRSAGVHVLSLTVEPNIEGQASRFTGEALLCGSNLGAGIEPAGYTSGSIVFPRIRTSRDDRTLFRPLVQSRCANPQYYNTEGEDDPAKRDCPSESGPYSLEEGQYLGSVGIGFSDAPHALYNDASYSDIYVQSGPDRGAVNTHCTPEAIACYVGTNHSLAKAGMTITSDGRGRNVLNIYPIQLLSGADSGLYYTRIGNSNEGLPINLCAYAGGPDARTCPSSGEWVQRNNAAAESTCNVGDWMYSMGWGVPAPADAWRYVRYYGGTRPVRLRGYGFQVRSDNNVLGGPRNVPGGSPYPCSPLTISSAAGAGGPRVAKSSGRGHSASKKLRKRASLKQRKRNGKGHKKSKKRTSRKRSH